MNEDMLITDYVDDFQRRAQSSGGEESTETEFVEEEKPWPPACEDRSSRSHKCSWAPRLPRPHSHLFRIAGGRARASKHTRRWENCESIASRLMHGVGDKIQLFLCQVKLFSQQNWLTYELMATTCTLNCWLV